MEKNNLNFNLPKNIKQIGSVDEGFKIYMEDFVFSFLNQYSKEKKGDEVIAVLIGENYTIDGNEVLFINGAIKGEHTISENGILKLSEKSFENIEKEIDTYFSGKKIVGWFYSQPGFSDYINDEYVNYHIKTFKKPYQVFFLSDPLENICSFYKYNKNSFENIKGFIIYYEKNDAMNEYILANKAIDINIEKEKFKEKDEKLMKIKRKNLPEKNKSKTLEDQRKMANIFSSLSAVLFLICFIMGAGLIQSDDRISELETKLAKLDQSYKYILTQVKDDNVQSVFAESNEYNSNNVSSELETNPSANISKNYYESTTENTTQITEESTTENTTENTTQSIEQNNAENTYFEENTQVSENYKTYQVKDGDSLEAISKKFYGDRSKINDIMEANGINDPHKIYSGMTIKLP